jgi:hypothetical protein
VVRALRGERAAGFEGEAIKEIAPGHELHGLTLTAIAKCEGCDEVMFQAPNDIFAMVHLTWTGRPEPLPWPRAKRLESQRDAQMAMDQHEH